MVSEEVQLHNKNRFELLVVTGVQRGTAINQPYWPFKIRAATGFSNSSIRDEADLLFNADVIYVRPQDQGHDLSNFRGTGVPVIGALSEIPQVAYHRTYHAAIKGIQKDGLIVAGKIKTSLKPSPKTHKAKARLVVLGFQDPDLDTIARDSPTLGCQARMLILQLAASMRWTLRSFNIKAAFLQGRTQEGRILGLEPVPELRDAMGLQPNEICKLAKSAYGLIDAPYLWFQELDKALKGLGFQSALFDPCTCVLYKPGKTEPSGIIGMYVDAANVVLAAVALELPVVKDHPLWVMDRPRAQAVEGGDDCLIA